MGSAEQIILYKCSKVTSAWPNPGTDQLIEACIEYADGWDELTYDKNWEKLCDSLKNVGCEGLMDKSTYKNYYSCLEGCQSHVEGSCDFCDQVQSPGYYEGVPCAVECNKSDKVTLRLLSLVTVAYLFIHEF